MTATHIREWPRMIAAVAVVAVVLVFAGVAAALATSGSGSGNSGQSARVADLRQVNATQSARLAHDGQALAQLQSVVRSDAGHVAAARRELAQARAALAISSVRARCWRARALHYKPSSVLKCAAVH